MFFNDKPYTTDRVIRIVLAVTFIIGTFWLLNYLSAALIPFVVAFLLAYIINPLVVRIEKVVKRRSVAITVTLLGMVLVAAIALAVLIPLFIEEYTQASILIKQLISDSNMSQRITAFIPEETWLAIKNSISTENLASFFSNKEYLKEAQEIVKKILPGAVGLMAGTMQVIMAVVALFMVTLYLVFLLKDFNSSKEEWKALIPNQYRNQVLDFFFEVNVAMSTYFRAQANISAIVGILFAFGFWLINLPLGIFLGLFIGLLNMVPYLQLLAVPPALFFAFIGALETGSNPFVMMGLVVAVFVVVQIIQDAILTPRIMGKVTGLSPAMILLSLSVWGKLLGLLGLIIAIPASCILLASYKRLQAQTHLKHEITGSNTFET